MKYTLEYHPHVVSEDIPRLGSNKTLVEKIILAKLTEHPEHFGQPLTGVLKNYRKLRVSSYRVIFRVNSNIVTIEKIGHRSTIYKEAIKRLMKNL
jgi:addiction module RelE/StbE family toxin